VILPFALLLAAAGVECLCVVPRSRLAKISGTVVVSLLLVVLLGGNVAALRQYYSSFEENIDIRVVEHLESRVRPEDIVVCDSRSIAMNIWYHWDPEIPLDSVAWPLYAEKGWVFSKELGSVSEEPVRWEVTLEEVLSRPRVWLVSQAGFGTPQLIDDLVDLMPPVSTEDFGPFSVYLFVP
jgi:hypothetical protein